MEVLVYQWCMFFFCSPSLNTILSLKMFWGRYACAGNLHIIIAGETWASTYHFILFFLSVQTHFHGIIEFFLIQSTMWPFLENIKKYHCYCLVFFFLAVSHDGQSSWSLENKQRMPYHKKWWIISIYNKGTNTRTKEKQQKNKNNTISF